MTTLEQSYVAKYSAWASLKEAVVMKRTIMASKLNTVKSQTLNLTLDRLVYAFTALSEDDDFDETDTLPALQSYIDELVRPPSFPLIDCIDCLYSLLSLSLLSFYPLMSII